MRFKRCSLAMSLVLIFILFHRAVPLEAAERSLRVGLAAPNTVYNKVEISFDGPHTVSGLYGMPPALSFNSAASYEVTRYVGNYEISSPSFKKIEEAEITKFPSGLPLVTEQGLRFILLEKKAAGAVRTWAESSIENVSFIVVTEGGKPKFALFDSTNVISPQKGELFQFYSYPYRGSLSFYFEGIDGVFPINTVEVEDYLYGVVPREMPSSWHLEALKAQAVCARTYALSSLGKYSDWDYDLAPTTHSQVYGGYSAEVNSTNQAVDLTRGEELFYGDSRVECFFHASNGGYMANSQDVFVTKLPYFNAKPDPYTESLDHSWELEIDGSVLTDYILKEGQDIGAFLYVDTLEINPSRRVDSLRIVGSAGSYTMDAGTFRYLTDIDSLYFGLSPKPAEGTQAKPEVNSLSVLSSKGLETQPVDKLFVLVGDGKKQKLSRASVKTAKGLVPLEIQEINRKSPFQWLQSPKGTKIYGYGNGHGLGLSQWGAMVMAEQGKNYREILSFYYDGATIKK